MEQQLSKPGFLITGLRALLIISLFAVNPGSHASNTPKEYIMGVFPHLPPRELEKVFSPMAADLSKVVGKPIIFRTSSTYQKFMETLGKQVFDIAFVQPFDYVRIADKYGYQPIATRQEKLSAIIVTKQDSPLTDLKDLKHKTISMPPKVAAVSHLIKDLLNNYKFVPGKDIKLSYHRSHVSCMQQVLIGTADACGTAAPALRFFEHKMKVTLKIISRSKAIPHTLFSVHPRVPKKERQKIQARILQWAKTDAGKKLLATGRMKPYRTVKDSEYDIVRRMAK